jgi:hypothetical protein
MNNKARSEAELARIKAQGGLVGVEVAVEPSIGGKQKRAAPKKTDKPRTKRARRGRKPRDEESEESAESSGEEVGDEDESPIRLEPPKTRGRGRQQATGGEKGRANPDAAAAPTTTSAAPTTMPDAAATTNTATATAATNDVRAAAKKGAKWAEDARIMLLEGRLGDEDSWKKVTNLWWDLEASTSFTSPVGIPLFCLR